jgi:hypothetical protein
VSGSAEVERQQLFIAATYLDQGRRVDVISRVVTIAAMVGLVPLAQYATAPSTILVAGAALAGLGETFLAARVAADAALFRRQAEAETPDWGAFDEALRDLGLMPAAKVGRPTAARFAGARRLLTQQASCLAAQFVLLAAAAALS